MIQARAEEERERPAPVPEAEQQPAPPVRSTEQGEISLTAFRFKFPDLVSVAQVEGG